MTASGFMPVWKCWFYLEIHNSQKSSSAPLYSVNGVKWNAQKQDLQKPTQWVTEKIASEQMIGWGERHSEEVC